jgi:predicted transcriptional regulator
MKTAISLPDDLFERLERCARRLKLSRSGLLAAAAREFLEREEPDAGDATEAWNRAIAAGGQPGDDPAAVAARRHSLRRMRRRPGKRR